VVLVIGAALALVSAVAAVVLIRTEDFESSSQRGHLVAASGETEHVAPAPQ